MGLIGIGLSEQLKEGYAWLPFHTAQNGANAAAPVSNFILYQLGCYRRETIHQRTSETAWQKKVWRTLPFKLLM
jgi:hypothetical protein